MLIAIIPLSVVIPCLNVQGEQSVAIMITAKSTKAEKRYASAFQNPVAIQGKHDITGLTLEISNHKILASKRQSDTRDKRREISKIQSVMYHIKNPRQHRESLLHVNRKDSQKDYGSASEKPRKTGPQIELRISSYFHEVIKVKTNTIKTKAKTKTFRRDICGNNRTLSMSVIERLSKRHFRFLRAG
jgi:hypothetical protein